MASMTKKLSVVAFLQNQWFEDPARMENLFNRYFNGDRESFIRRFLFYKCLTGKRLKAALGDAWCDTIHWEECSPRIGGRSGACYDPDLDHMAGVVRGQRINVILSFGNVAADGVAKLVRSGVLTPNMARDGLIYIAAPHPAARQPDVQDKLRELRKGLDYWEEIKAGLRPGIKGPVGFPKERYDWRVHLPVSDLKPKLVSTPSADENLFFSRLNADEK